MSIDKNPLEMAKLDSNLYSISSMLGLVSFVLHQASISRSFHKPWMKKKIKAGVEMIADALLLQLAILMEQLVDILPPAGVCLEFKKKGWKL